MPKKNTQPAPLYDDGLPEDLRTKIISFKELFPQYRQATNDDILDIFQQFNNNYEEVVYGVMNQLETVKPAESWQRVGKKKKPKNQNRQSRGQTPTRGFQSSRGQSAKRSDPRPDERSTENKSRGATRGKSATRPPRKETPNRGRSASVRGSTHQTSVSSPRQNSPPPPVVASNPPAQPSAPLQPSTPPVKPKSSNFVQGLSYANVAKSRQPWNPNRPKQEKPLQDNTTPTPEIKKPAQPEPQAPVQPAEPILPNNNAAASVPMPTSAGHPSNPVPVPASQSFNQPPVEMSPPQKMQPIDVQSNNTKEERPRVGVLLPGNFTSDDSMSFQFGKLGILEDDDFVSQPSSSDQELKKPQASSSQLPSDASRNSNKQPTQNPAQAKGAQNTPEEMQEMQGMPMNPHAYASLQYPMYPGMEGTDPRGPMAFYPPGESSFQPGGYGREGKPFRGNQTQNFSGRDNSSKFPSESGPNASQNAPQFFGYPMYPYMNQFPGGSYGNQFYPGYPYKGFPGYSQNFPNSMYNGPEEEQGGKPNRSSSPYYPQDSASLGRESGNKQQSNASQASQSKGQNKSNPSLEGNFPSEYKQNPQMQDYYSTDYMGSQFMNPGPFYHPGAMGTGYPPQSQSSQSNQNQTSNPRNY